MAYRIILDPLAKLDIIDIIDWYNSKGISLGFKFYKQVQAIIKRVQKNPLLFVSRYKNIRTAPLKKFPYLVHYFIEEEKKLVVIIAIMHTSRNPETWNDRLK